MLSFMTMHFMILQTKGMVYIYTILFPSNHDVCWFNLFTYFIIVDFWSVPNPST